MEHQRDHLDRQHGEIERHVHPLLLIREVGFADVLEHRKGERGGQGHGGRAYPTWLINWETRRPIWLMEMLAEAIGVFFYVYGGLGATASFYTSSAGIPPAAGFGSILTIGINYGLAITFALIVAAPTSGGHLNPCFTIAFVLFKGFPLRKLPQYIVSQIFGAYVAALLVYVQYGQQLDAIFAEFSSQSATSALLFTSHGPPGVLALFSAPGQQLGLVFINEFVCCVFLSILVFSVLDNSNIFISWSSAPFLIGAGYLVIITGFAFETVALNSARDLGGRCACATIWGRACFTSQSAFTAIAALTNIPATLLGAMIQTLILSDSARPIVTVAPTVDATPQTAPSLRALSRDDGTSNGKTGYQETTIV